MSNHETPSYNQISEQYQVGYDEPTVLIKRSKGQIQTAALTNDRDEHGRRFVTFSENGEQWDKPVSDQALTDEAQLSLAQELAGNYELPTKQEIEKLVAVVKTVGHEATDSALAEIDTSADKPRVELRAEDIDRAINELDRKLDSKLEAVFRGVEATPVARRAAIDPNSGDQEKREALENLLRITIDQIGGEGKLPERVQRNDLNDMKSVADQKLGYEEAKYSPRDYAAKVALALLDGSFRGDPRKRDYSDLPANDPRNGQHRQAALMTLDRLMHEKEPIAESNDEVGEAMRQARRILSEFGSSDTLRHAEALTHQDQVNPDELVAIVRRLDDSLTEMRTRFSRLSPENADDDRALIQVSEQLTGPAYMIGEAYADSVRWSRYLEEQGNSPGITRMQNEIMGYLNQAIQQLKQIQ